MYGLSQKGIIQRKLLGLNSIVYAQSKAAPGLWTHYTQLISFTLIVDDLRVIYSGEEHAMHMVRILHTVLRNLGILDMQQVQCNHLTLGFPQHILTRELSKLYYVLDMKSPKVAKFASFS